MSHASWKHVVGVVGVGFVAVFGVGLARTAGNVASSSEGPAEERARHTFARLGVVAAGSKGRLCSFEPGARMAYEVHSSTEVELDMSRLSQSVDVQAGTEVVTTPPQHHVVERDWRLELAAIARGEDGSSVLAARIEDRGTTVEGGGISPPDNPHLSDTFLIRVDANCNLHEFGWRSEGDLEAAYEQQVMAAGLGFSGPAQTAEAASYGALSFDATGRYMANYRYEDGRIEGAATSYILGREAQRGAPVGANVLSSTIEVELGPSVWFETLTNERDLEFTLQGRGFGTHFRSTKAARVEPGSFTPSVDLDDGGWSFGLVLPPQRDPSQDFDETLRDRPAKDLLSSYRELIAAGEHSETKKLLRDWLRANPGQTRELIALLQAGEFDGDDTERATLFAALGEANTDEAKLALTDILADWPRPEEQIWAAHAIAGVEQPSAEMIELIAGSARDADLHPVARASMALALGSVAGGDSEGATMARDQIREWLETPADDAQLGLGLAAAGNAGSDELADAVGVWIEHETPQVREQATKALRQMSPELATPHLERALDDEDVGVRATAFETAATVARKYDRAPSESLIERAGASLDELEDLERRAAVTLLGEAARRGDTRADALLREHLSERLESGDASPQELAALGRHAAGHWQRSN